jgi:hypothetical protein
MAREIQLITDAQQDIFLAAYRKTGLLQKSAKIAGLNKHQIDKFSKGNTAEAETFALNLQDAADSWGDTIREELTRRAIDGIDENVYYKGQWLETKRVYSDSLLTLMATSTLSEYKKTPEQATGGVVIQINTFSDKPASVVIDQLESLE